MGTTDAGKISPIAKLQDSEGPQSVDLRRSVTPDRPPGKTEALEGTSLDSEDTHTAIEPFSEKASVDFQRQDILETRHEPTPPPANPAQASILRAWWQEFSAVAFATAGMVSICGVLFAYDGQRAPSLPDNITVGKVHYASEGPC